MPELEGTKAVPKGAEEATQKPVSPTLKYSEEDYQRAVSKGLESTQRQLDLRVAEAKKVKAEAEQYKAEITARDAQIEAMQREVNEALTDDPERMAAYTSRLKALEREQKMAKREAEIEGKVYEAELKLWQAGMGLKAQELAREFPHLNLDLKGLISDSATEAEMETKVLRLASKQEPKPKEEKTPKFESGISSGGGTPSHPSMDQLDKMTPEEYAQWYKSRKK